MSSCPICGRTLSSSQPMCDCRAPQMPSGVKLSGVRTPASRSAIHRSNRKVCAECQADVTFAPRQSTQSGRWLCIPCAEQLAAPIDLGGLDEAEMEPQHVDVSAFVPQVRRAAPIKAKPPSKTGLIVAGTAVLVLALAAALIWVFQPTWEDQHKVELRGKLADAAAARERHDLRTAYGLYADVTQQARGQTISSPVLAGELQAAQQREDELYPQVQAQLKQEADAKAAAERAEAAAAAARERARQEADRVAAAEKARQEAEARHAADAAAAAKSLAARRNRIHNSTAYTDIVREANRVAGQADVALAGEDSAYRAISASAEANFELVVLLARQQALLNGTNVDVSLKPIERLHSTAMAGEDSAIRAIYKHDQAMLQAMGVLARHWTQNARADIDLTTKHGQIVRDAMQVTSGDDSAPRAIMTFNAANMRMLAAFAESRDIQIADILKAASQGNSSDDSAWQVTDTNSDAQARIAVQILKASDPARAASIENDRRIREAGESSALRSIASSKKALTQVLVALIAQ